MRASQNGKCLDGRIRKNTGRDRERDSKQLTLSASDWLSDIVDDAYGAARSRRASVVSAGLDNGAS